MLEDKFGGAGKCRGLALENEIFAPEARQRLEDPGFAQEQFGGGRAVRGPLGGSAHVLQGSVPKDPPHNRSPLEHGAFGRCEAVEPGLQPPPRLWARG